jgi:methylglutaconyl-CoA hydratase
MTQPSTGQFVRFQSTGPVTTLTLDSDHNRNALSRGLMEELLAGLRAALADDSTRVVVLSHAGPVFCSGMDLHETQRSDAENLPAASLPALLRVVWESPKPVVARIGGPARAGGIGLIAACDLAIASEDATFAFSEVRLGVIPAVISATVLPRLTSRAAAELFLTGASFDGRRAAEIGLLTAAVGADQLDETVDSYLTRLLQGGPHALAGIKQLLHRAHRGELGTELEELSSLSVRYFTSAEGREGVAAFGEKRDPAWIGAHPAGPITTGPRT